MNLMKVEMNYKVLVLKLSVQIVRRWTLTFIFDIKVNYEYIWPIIVSACKCVYLFLGQHQ